MNDHHPAPGSARERRRRFALALLGLCVVFELPSLAQPDRVTLSGLRVPGDALLLAALALALAHARARGWALAFTLRSQRCSPRLRPCCSPTAWTRPCAWC